MLTSDSFPLEHTGAAPGRVLAEKRGWCWERTEDAARREERVMHAVRGQNMFYDTRRGHSMLLGGDRGHCCWERTEDAGREQKMLVR